MAAVEMEGTDEVPGTDWFVMIYFLRKICYTAYNIWGLTDWANSQSMVVLYHS
jgi:hypothetical protein